MPRTHNGERIVSSVNDVKKTGYPHPKEVNWNFVLRHTQKLIQNGLKLNVGSETIKLPQEKWKSFLTWI